MLWVAQLHIGQFPFRSWALLRNTSANIAIFTFLAGFGLSGSTSREIAPTKRRNFLITRVGAMQTMVMLSMLYALPAAIIACYPGINEVNEAYLTLYNITQDPLGLGLGGSTCVQSTWGLGWYILGVLLSLSLSMFGMPYFNTAGLVMNGPAWYNNYNNPNSPNHANHPNHLTNFFFLLF